MASGGCCGCGTAASLGMFGLEFLVWGGFVGVGAGGGFCCLPGSLLGPEHLWLGLWAGLLWCGGWVGFGLGFGGRDERDVLFSGCGVNLDMVVIMI